MTTYTANKLNQYTELSGAKTATPLHDDDGNVTDYKNMKYSWNAENQMISAEPKNPSEGDKKTEYLYDYMGRRARKQISVYSSGAWTLSSEKLFVYDGWNLVKEITKEGASSSDKYYVWGPDLSQSLQGAGGIGGLVCAVHGGNLYRYFYDANGNVGQVVNETGSIVARYEYDPFGNIVNGVPQSDDNPFRFSTKYYDEETGLYYYGFRDYSSELGRWWSRDPLGERGGVHLYGFVYNNPINEADLLGFDRCDGLTSLKRNIESYKSSLEFYMRRYEEYRTTGMVKDADDLKKFEIDMTALEKVENKTETQKTRLERAKRYYKYILKPKVTLAASTLEGYKADIDKYSQEHQKAILEYARFYNENDCGGCREFYCRYMSAAIGIGLDYAGFIAAASGVGAVGNFALFGFATANNAITMLACESYDSSLKSEGFALLGWGLSFFKNRVASFFGYASGVGDIILNEVGLAEEMSIPFSSSPERMIK